MEFFVPIQTVNLALAALMALSALCMGKAPRRLEVTLRA